MIVLNLKLIIRNVMLIFIIKIIVLNKIVFITLKINVVVIVCGLIMNVNLNYVNIWKKKNVQVILIMNNVYGMIINVLV